VRPEIKMRNTQISALDQCTWKNRSGSIARGHQWGWRATDNVRRFNTRIYYGECRGGLAHQVYL